VLLSRSFLSFSLAASAFLFAASAEAATYVTQISGTGSGETIISRIEITWSTNVAVGGDVRPGDLTDLVFSIYDNGNTLIFTDHAINDGVVQTVGGVPRTLSDIDFIAVSGVYISDFDNDINTVEDREAEGGGATGITFNMYCPGVHYPGTEAIIFRYVDGVRMEPSNLNDLTVTTTVIPEPSACMAFAGMFGLTLLRRKRA